MRPNDIGRIALRLLNRRSPLYLAKGRVGGSSRYRGARWHTCASIRDLFNGLPISNLRLHSAVLLLLLCGREVARPDEPCLAHCTGGHGAFIAASAEMPIGFIL